jgi:hypothetical protein
MPRVGISKRGRPPKPKPEQKEPGVRRGRGRPPSAHLFFSDAQKYLVLAWQIIEDQKITKSRGREVLSDATYVRRYMRKSHIETVKRNGKISISIEKIQSKIKVVKDPVERDRLIKKREVLQTKIEWTQQIGRMFRPSGPGGRWADKDFKNHIEYRRTYRHVCRHLATLRRSIAHDS